MKAARRKKTKSIGEGDYRALAAFRHALRQFLVFSEEAARAVGLTPQQHQALLAIKGHVSGAQVTVGELAEHLLIRHNSAVELVNRLVAAKLVSKAGAAEDRRRVIVTLTPRAEAILRDLSAAHLDELRRSGTPFIELAQRLERD
ncbi:MAG: helix-turn-helix domain-containing protein [Parvibaculum sp.]|uniref:MarR family winged helix-turn-helix transcriptional regulator n=1 Tax=Parvibaculum sp. TaxID=2024848 RepID=UPI00284C1A0F|nr:helix-turn-helix domain-containing protein [Parvibaculum sp.]MDR3500514.1 helix-turn-helix domain-containing protein [Parvibaculum sp.]